VKAAGSNPTPHNLVRVSINERHGSCCNGLAGDGNRMRLGEHQSIIILTRAAKDKCSIKLRQKSVGFGTQISVEDSG
jgi:hypothetical protein